jgi:hypothetical protein
MRLNLLTGGALIGSCLDFFSLSFASEDLDQKDIWQDTVWQQWPQRKPDWLEPTTPSQIIGNIHYVGPQGIGAYLIVSDQGHIVLAGALPQNAQQISANIVSLGFDLSAAKYPIN